MTFSRIATRSFLGFLGFLGALAACGGEENGAADSAALGRDARAGVRFPLRLLGDVNLPGRANRFDYQDVDRTHSRLILTHMNDASVVVAKLDGTGVVKVLPNIPTPRGVVVADEVGRIFVTSSPQKLVIIDSESLSEVARVATGNGPDGVGWDALHRVVGVSDQRDGAISLIKDAGTGERVAVRLGDETGNVVFDPSRGVFWVTVVTANAPDRLIAVDPVLARATVRIDLPGCEGAHGLRIHPDGKSAFVACEGNDRLLRVALDTEAHAAASAQTGAGPDVLAIDADLGLLYVAAESGDLVVFDIAQPALARVHAENVGSHAHSVSVDPATHRVFFPLQAGPSGAPVLRIMRPNGL